MGVIDPGLRCKTCAGRAGECPGHFGHVAIWTGTKAELIDAGVWDELQIKQYASQISTGSDPDSKNEHQVIEALTWQGDIALAELRPATFSPEIPGVLQGKIQTSGNLQQALLTAAFSMRDATAVEVNWDANLDLQLNLETLLLTVNECTLKHKETAAQIALSGTADGAQHQDITLHWQDLQWH